MSLPRIYADFNSIEGISDNEATLDLTGYGSLASLSRAKIQLREGMKLLLCEPNDVEVEGTTLFDISLKDPAGRTGRWLVKIDPRLIRDSQYTEANPKSHPCFTCRTELYEHLRTFGWNYNDFCPHCGASIMLPLAPPS
jgi:hypothetical protein